MQAYPPYLRRAMLKAGVPESRIRPETAVDGSAALWSVLRAEARAECSKARATIRARRMLAAGRK